MSDSDSNKYFLLVSVKGGFRPLVLRLRVLRRERLESVGHPSIRISGPAADPSEGFAGTPTQQVHRFPYHLQSADPRLLLAVAIMSSMRNAIPRRSHKERSQPHDRTKRGLLEKRKDYILRSQDYKRKQQTLKRLSEKASERNPDEFYFSMTNERTEKGVAIADRPGSKSLGVKDIKPLKMQDATYLRTMRNIEKRNIDRLRSVVPSVSGKKGTKILFAEDPEEGIHQKSLVVNCS